MGILRRQRGFIFLAGLVLLFLNAPTARAGRIYLSAGAGGSFLIPEGGLGYGGSAGLGYFFTETAGFGFRVDGWYGQDDPYKTTEALHIFLGAELQGKLERSWIPGRLFGALILGLNFGPAPLNSTTMDYSAGIKVDWDFPLGSTLSFGPEGVFIVILNATETLFQSSALLYLKLWF